MRDFARPIIVSSKCIEFEACRYDGVMISSDQVRQLKSFAGFLPVCPEVEIGLGVPRSPIRIVKAGERRLIQPETGLDLTERMESFLSNFLGSLGQVDGFILKDRSPSCGLKNVKVYTDPESRTHVAKGAGLFGAAVLDRFTGLAVEDEWRLKDCRIREAFLTRLFTLASLRRTAASRSMKELVRFQTDNELLLMAYGRKHLRSLGRIVANPDRRPPGEVIGGYRESLEKALASPPRSTSCISVLIDAMGRFKKQMSSRETGFFLAALEEYRNKRTPLSVPVGIMKSHIVRFEEPYLMKQTFFEPYPPDLVTVGDSGEGRGL